MPKVSVIVPVYNSEKYLEQCLYSIINQTYSNIEIIIVDDGSTDKSKNIYSYINNKDCRIKIIKENHKGPSNARNRGIEEATGDYILFVDSDDWIDEKLVEKCINIYEKYDIDCIVYEANTVYPKKVEKEGSIYKEGIYNKHEVISKLIIKEKINSPWNKMYKKSIIDSNNIKYDDDIVIGEDLLFNINYFKFIEKIYISNEKMYNYRMHNSSLTKKYIPNKYEQLMFVNEKMKQELEEICSKELTEALIYIKFKNICSSLRDVLHRECKFNKKEIYSYVEKVKTRNKRIIVKHINLKILILSYIYSLSNTKTIGAVLYTVKKIKGH